MIDSLHSSGKSSFFQIELMSLLISEWIVLPPALTLWRRNLVAIWVFKGLTARPLYVVGPCHHGMARPQVADRGTASDKEGSCE